MMKNFSFGGKRHRTSGNHRNLAAAGHKPRSSRRDLQMETLEDRSLLAVNPLVISEINYHPTVPYSGAFDKDQYEFVELYNAGGTPLQLAGVTFQAHRGDDEYHRYDRKSHLGARGLRAAGSQFHGDARTLWGRNFKQDCG